jgi:nuclear pore complex protein Nup205
LDTSLRFVEKCLDTVDFQSFEQIAILEDRSTVAQGEGLSTHQKEMLAIATSPGFQVLLAFLCNGEPILYSLFQVAKEGVEAYNGQSSIHRSAIARVLRVTNQILTWQSVMKDICLGLQDLKSVEDLSMVELPTRPLQGVDQYLIYHQQDVVNLASFVAAIPWFSDSHDVAHLAVRLLLVLSASPAFGGSLGGGSTIGLDNRTNRLVLMLTGSNQASAILKGFMERLATPEAPETRLSAQEFYFSGLDDVERASQPLTGLLGVSNDEVELVLGKTAQGPKHHYSQGHLDHSVRGEMLELILKNLLDRNRVQPTLSHWLLGYNTRAPLKETTFSDPTVDSTAQVGVLHILLELLKDPMTDYPNLMEQCLHILATLCEDGNTADPTMRYLATSLDFFHTQLDGLSTDFLGPSRHLATQELDWQDADPLTSLRNFNLQNAWIMFARLHQRAWLLKMIALDLKRNAQHGHRARLQKTLRQLYDVPSMSHQFDEMDEQRMMKSLDILNSVDLSSGFDASPRPTSTLFDALDVSAFLTTNERGCPVIDVRAAWATMLSIQRTQEGRNSNLTQAQRDQTMRDMQMILKSWLEENYARELFFAQRNCLRAWKDMIGVTLSDECFQQLAADQRETIVYEHLQALLPKMNAEDTSSLVAEDMAELVGLLVAKLATSRGEQGVHHVPIDMLSPILQGILSATLRSDASGYMRGHLYSALLSLLQLTDGDHVGEKALVKTGTITSQITFLGLVTNAGDRLLDLLATDAMDADEDVWKATAYACLDAICNLTFKFGGRNDRILTYLTRRNYLGLFIMVLQREDSQLQTLMQQDAVDSLNPLYVFEQKMALFLRLAGRRDGAEKLLDSGIMEALARMGSLDLLPEIVTLRQDGIQGLNTRFEQLLEPTLRLVNEIVGKMGGDNVDVVRRVAIFIQAHQDTLANIIKDKSSPLTTSGLRLLELTTGLFSHVAARPDLVDKPFQGSASFQTLILQLFSRFTPDDSWKSRMQLETVSKRMLNGVLVVEREANFVAKEIVRNVLTYCEAITSRQFRPILSWNPSPPQVQEDNWALTTQVATTPSIGRLVNMMNDTSLELLRCQDEVVEWKTWLTRDNIDLARINQFLTGIGDLTATQKQRLALKHVEEWLTEGERLQEILFGIIERGMVLLYRHLDYYLTEGHVKPQAVARGFDPTAVEVERIKTELATSPVLTQTLDRLSRLELVSRVFALTDVERDRKRWAS